MTKQEIEAISHSMNLLMQDAWARKEAALASTYTMSVLFWRGEALLKGIEDAIKLPPPAEDKPCR